MASPQQTPSQKGWSRLEQLPPGALWTIAEFVGDIAIVTQSETADNFTETVLDSSAANAWEPNYNDLQSLALVSTSFRYPAQRALFRVAVLKTTAAIADHIRAPPIRDINPHPLVLSEFMHNIYQLMSTPSANLLPEHSFIRHTFERSLDTVFATHPAQWTDAITQIIDQRGINFHAIEDQVLTTVVQICTKITAARLCFGEPGRPPAPPGPVGVNIHQVVLHPNIFSYSSLLYDCPQDLKSLTLDFGAIYSMTNFRRHQPGYLTGLPPTIERLTVVGNRADSELPYQDFTIGIFAGWLSTNHQLRELRLVDDFDKMVRYTDSRATHVANPGAQPAQTLNWNGIFLSYADTLEVLEMGWDRPSALGIKARFGESGMLDCLPQMGRLRFLKAPLITLGGDFIVPLGNDDKVIDSVRTGFPNSLKKVDLLVVNPPQTRVERTDLKWRVVECRL
ncbi:hypothetical protein QBC32DRAFT_387157 [Pseudoneurospora amorphoporcata]|uniref:Uncharacterized protein n=1 Tax=Pseudoneurospora amorphoporcata TaxID=241081 RepID=A0AAN6SAW9_9PEZI|nr:hypothetical protein QBC32DRAFT_387157 [Pseudoneurospora amorphoporcata]